MSKTGTSKQSYVPIETRPVALYNPEKPELFAVMLSPDHARKYLFPYNPNRRSNITRALCTKSKLTNTVLDFKVSLRYATKEQAELLNEHGFYVKEGYYSPDKSLFFTGHEITNTK